MIHSKGPRLDEKWRKLQLYAKGIIKEVETIAHLVGVSEPRKMRRDHVRSYSPTPPVHPASTLYPSWLPLSCKYPPGVARQRRGQSPRTPAQAKTLQSPAQM
jgi:hypothetical protein